MVTLLKDFDPDNFIFKPVRKTATGSRIIDVDGNDSFQTCWLKILCDTEYGICVESDKIKNIFERIDEKVITHSSNVLEFSKQEILQMYRPISKNSNYFCISILTNTVLFDKNKNFYEKNEIKNVLKVGQNVRFIIKFKKIYFKDHELSFPLELLQIELA
jgi:hypothetical protein